MSPGDAKLKTETFALAKPKLLNLCQRQTVGVTVTAIRERRVEVKYLGNDHASHKAWMKKNLLDLMNFNKLSKTKKLVEAKLYDVRFYHTLN